MFEASLGTVCICPFHCLVLPSDLKEWTPEKNKIKNKRRLFLGRKVMTSLDSILKSRDITLPTKIHIVKAMVFPVAMYGCES